MTDTYSQELIDSLPPHLQQIYHSLLPVKQELMLFNVYFGKMFEHSPLAGIHIEDANA